MASRFAGSKKMTNFTLVNNRSPCPAFRRQTRREREIFCSMRFSQFRALVVLFFLVSFVATSLVAAGPGKGFQALALRDYFRAKKIFESAKQDAYSSFGLAIIYSRNDNPYTNTDTAMKFATRSFAFFTEKPQAKSYSGFSIDSLSLISLLDTLSARKLSQILPMKSVKAYDDYLLQYYAGNKKNLLEAVSRRDGLEFDRLMVLGKSDSTNAFLATHPQSRLYTEAILLRDRQLFDEYTVTMRAESYRAFIKKYSHNAMVAMAQEKLFAIYKESSDLNGLQQFVRDYPDARQNLDAWKLLFALSVRSYTDEELQRFLEAHPDFPLKNSILKDLRLNKLVLYPYQRDELTGFIDSARSAIHLVPQYDEVTPFYEGLSVVNRNDTVFYINKEGENPFPVTYSSAGRFEHGVAPVRRGNRWHFINRQGQVVSRDYEEIGELSNGIYVIKSGGKYGALNSFGQSLLQPTFEKLGDFANGMAWYIANNKYGFVNVAGDVFDPDFDWLSDFGDDGLAIMRRGQKFGLVNAAGECVLEANWDKVIRAQGGIYIVVKGGSYGFFEKSGCFLTPVMWDYQGDLMPDFYSNRSLLKLIRKDRQSLVDVNGAPFMPFGEFRTLGFPASGLIVASQLNKKELSFGYLNQKQSTVIPFRFALAEDFNDSLAVVKLKERYCLIDLRGMERYSSDFRIERLSANYFVVAGDQRQIIDGQGRVVVSNVTDIQSPRRGIWIITNYSGEIKLLYD